VGSDHVKSICRYSHTVYSYSIQSTVNFGVIFNVVCQKYLTYVVTLSALKCYLHMKC